jgi:hypothetical protein
MPVSRRAIPEGWLARAAGRGSVDTGRRVYQELDVTGLTARNAWLSQQSGRDQNGAAFRRFSKKEKPRRWTHADAME